MKSLEAVSTVIGTAGATLLGASWYLGDIFEFTVTGGILILLSGCVTGAGVMIEDRKRDVHFREKMDTLRLKKY